MRELRQEFRHRDGNKETLIATLYVNAEGEHHEWWAIVFEDKNRAPHVGKSRYIHNLWKEIVYKKR
jgi:hypothetical protein